MNRLQPYAPDALMLAGAISLSYGAGMVYQPAGFIVAGTLALVAGWLLAGAVGDEIDGGEPRA